MNTETSDAIIFSFGDGAQVCVFLIPEEHTQFLKARGRQETLPEPSTVLL